MHCKIRQGFRTCCQTVSRQAMTTSLLIKTGLRLYISKLLGVSRRQGIVLLLTEQEQLCNECNIHDWPHIDRVNKQHEALCICGRALTDACDVKCLT